MNRLIRKCVAFLLLGLLLWSPVAMAASSVAVIQLADPTFTTNMYEGKSTDSGSVATLRHGTGVTVHSSGAVWSEVSVGDTRGYVLSQYIHTSAEKTNTDSYTDGYVKPDSEGGTVPLYNNATSTGSVIGYYPLDTYVKVYFTQGLYSYVEINGQFGYILTAYLSSSKSIIIQPPVTNTGNAVVHNQNPAHKLNLRQSPNVSSPSLGMYPQGTSVTVVEYGATWCKVEVSGKTGYMFTANLKFKE